MENAEMILDSRGRPIADTENVWMVQMLFEWLNDDRVRKLILRRRLFAYPKLEKLGLALHLELKTRALEASSPLAPRARSLDRLWLKWSVLTVLRDPVVRRSIARSIVQRLGWRWSDVRDNRRQLQTLREDLEAELAARNLVWREES